MTEQREAVMCALRTVLVEAEARQGQLWWETHIVNRWIDQLPGAWRGKWRRLRLSPDSGESATRANVVTHIRATLAYVEAGVEESGWTWRWWPQLRGRAATQAAASAAPVEGSEKSRPSGCTRRCQITLDFSRPRSPASWSARSARLSLRSCLTGRGRRAMSALALKADMSAGPMCVSFVP